METGMWWDRGWNRSGDSGGMGIGMGLEWRGLG